MYNFDESLVSDLYKDAYGSRSFANLWPSNGSESEKQEEWNRVNRDLAIAIEQQNDYNKMALDNFESLVSESMSYGATTRQQAIKWVLQGAGYKEDSDYQTDSIDYAFYQLGVCLNDAAKIKREAGI